MDRGSVDVSDIRHLSGVTKTLRRLYAPAEAPNAAIARALDALARRETTGRARGRRLAPAA